MPKNLQVLCLFITLAMFIATGGVSAKVLVPEATGQLWFSFPEKHIALSQNQIRVHDRSDCPVNSSNDSNSIVVTGNDCADIKSNKGNGFNTKSMMDCTGATTPKVIKNVSSITICGTNHDDYIIGSEDSDNIFGLAGNDIIGALGGVDTVYAGPGDDTVYGGDGNNQLFGQDDNDNLVGGFEDDLLVGGPGNNRLYGNTGDDILQGGPGADYFDCGDGLDTVIDYNPSQGDVVSVDCENVNLLH
jgi:Ca2+-binding RTX toxin-like protein